MCQFEAQPAPCTSSRARHGAGMSATASVDENDGVPTK